MSTRLPVADVPVTVITGFLGVGKTTAMLDLLQHRTTGSEEGQNDRWAVLVNEFGEIGIDGAILESDGLAVAEVPGGCICCSAGLALRTTLVRLLREQRPTRLLIEPTGLAHPASVIDTLRSPGLREAVQVKAVIGLVDPRHVRSPRHRASDPWNDQVRIADVLVANKTDLASADDLEAFRTLAAEQWPPKLVVAETKEGRLDPAWLDLGPPEREVQATEATAGHTHTEHDPSAAETRGFVWRPYAAFDRDQLEAVLQELVRPGPVLAEGVLRLKGVFRVRRGWFLVQASADEIRWSPIGHRRDSRVELIVPANTADWAAVEAKLGGARIRV